MKYAVYCLSQVLPELSDNECENERLAAYMGFLFHIVCCTLLIYSGYISINMKMHIYIYIYICIYIYIYVCITGLWSCLW